jgi:hypothetical protein
MDAILRSSSSGSLHSGKDWIAPILTPDAMLLHADLLNV